MTQDPIKNVKTDQHELLDYVRGNKINLSHYGDGDIFKLARHIEMEALETNIKLTNIPDIYRWLIMLRDEENKVA